MRRAFDRARLRSARELYRLLGVDLTSLPGIQASTAQTLVSELGCDLSRWKSERHFASWLGLCPGVKITGGKAFKSRTRRVVNRAATALRLAAQAVGRSQTALGAFYRRLKSRLGAPKANTAETAAPGTSGGRSMGEPTSWPA